MNPPMSQRDLAAWIDREGLAFERRGSARDNWVPGKKGTLASLWVGGGYEIRLAPITTPLPPVKESLTPQPATGQSKTPRTDEQMESVHMFDPGETVVPSDFARTLETELNAALAERDEARRLLGEARRVMQGIYDDTEGYADGAPDASAHDRLCNDISGKLR